MNSILNPGRSALTLAVLLAFAELAVAQMVTVKERAYWGVVTLYAHGDRNLAVASIGGWTEKDLDAVADSVEGLAKAASKCEDCEARQRFDALPLRVAVLLHAQRDRMDRILKNKQMDGVADCSVSTQGLVSERLLRSAARQPGGRDFVARFSAAMSVDFRAMLCFLRAGEWAETGLKAAPGDALLLLARGLAAETIGVTGYAEPLPGMTYDGRGLTRVTRSDPIDKTRQLNLAREAFEKTLSIEPEQSEARLRLGRVLWRLGRGREARESLRKAASATDGSIRYLGRLFLGQCLEDDGDLAGAIDQYAAAVAMWPDAQIGAVALAHAHSRRGESEKGREILGAVLSLSGGRRTVDPYWNYLMGAPHLAEAFLEALRAESVK